MTPLPTPPSCWISTTAGETCLTTDCTDSGVFGAELPPDCVAAAAGEPALALLLSRFASANTPATAAAPTTAPMHAASTRRPRLPEGGAATGCVGVSSTTNVWVAGAGEGGRRAAEWGAARARSCAAGAGAR